MRKRWVYIEGEAYEVSEDFSNPRPANAAHNIIPDIQPYKSMVTGEMIQGRRQHREHLRTHNVVEVGDQVHTMKPYGPKPLPGLKQRLIEVTNAVLDKRR